MRAARALLVAGGAIAASVAATLACGPGDLSDLTRGDPVVTIEEAGAPPEIACKGAVPPEAPAPGSQTTLPEIIFAFDNLRVDALAGDAGTTLPVPRGYNLDNNCSCDKDYSCEPPTGADSAKLCDDAEGRDNIAGGLLADITLVLPTLRPAFLKQRIDKGVYSVLVSVVGWNGEANDDKVVVGLRMSTGIDNGLESPAVRTPPRFDGTDAWSVDPESVVSAPAADSACTTDLCVPRALGAGYVRDNRLVARFESVDLALTTGTGRVVIPFVGVVLTADIETDNGVRRLAGEMAGRWRANDLLAAVAAFNPEEPQAFQDLCNNDVAYDLFKKRICLSADLAASPFDDNKPGTKCGALSEAVRFTAVTAKLGTIRVAEVSDGTCRGPDTCP